MQQVQIEVLFTLDSPIFLRFSGGQFLHRQKVKKPKRVCPVWPISCSVYYSRYMDKLRKI